MNSFFVWTVGDVFGVSLLALLALIFLTTWVAGKVQNLWWKIKNAWRKQ